MGDLLRDPPWGNLWRWVVSTFFWYFVLGFPVAVLTDFDTGAWAPAFHVGLVVASPVIAAIVVWSEDVPWPGDH